MADSHTNSFKSILTGGVNTGETILFKTNTGGYINGNNVTIGSINYEEDRITIDEMTLELSGSLVIKNSGALNGDLDGDGDIDVIFDGGWVDGDTNSDGIADSTPDGIYQSTEGSNFRIITVNDGLATNSNITLKNFIFQNAHTATAEGAALQIKEDVDLENIIFRNNTTEVNGAAISITSSGQLSQSNCTFSSNTSEGNGSDIQNYGKL